VVIDPNKFGAAFQSVGAMPGPFFPADSAVAVAAGLVAFALGSDTQTAGSVREPVLSTTSSG
jgi:hypothetical protein